jgi:hypothetical protein
MTSVHTHSTQTTPHLCTSALMHQIQRFIAEAYNILCADMGAALTQASSSARSARHVEATAREVRGCKTGPIPLHEDTKPRSARLPVPVTVVDRGRVPPKGQIGVRMNCPALRPTARGFTWFQQGHTRDSVDDADVALSGTA